MPKKKHQDTFDDSFYKFANTVTSAIAKNKDGTDQKQQVEELLAAEKEFKETILKYKQSIEIYKKFLQKICVTNKNILSARPYFRESAISFSKRVTPSIKANNIELLQTFDINYQLISFIKESWLGPFPKKAEVLFNRVHKAREILIENNMPLAINRAKLFYRKTPKSQISLMDMINICAMGLSSAVDKFVGEYTTVFRGVIIGRCVGNLISEYSSTTLHFYPSDRRILYKANSIRGRQGIEDLEKLADAVNKSFKADKEAGITVPNINVSSGELSYLMSAASTISADQSTKTDGTESFGVYDYTPDSNIDLESSYIERESMAKMLSVASKLPILHKKILRLKGIIV